MSVHVSRVGSSVDLLGESPVWDTVRNAFFWIDSLAGIIRYVRLDDGDTRDYVVPAPVGCMALTENGNAILALRDAFAFLDLETGQLNLGASIDVTHPDVRLNDGKVDRRGRFVVGTMQSNRKNGVPVEGGIFRVGGEDGVSRLTGALAVANGPCFSLDGRTMYIADSPERVMWAYDYRSDGPLENKRLFVNTDSLNSGIDGATVDAEGYIWGALVRTGQIVRLTPDGEVERIVEVPVSHPTSLAFGGSNLDRLFLTSISRSTHLSATEPQAGGAFIIDGLGVKGLAPDRFRTVRPSLV